MPLTSNRIRTHEHAVFLNPPIAKKLKEGGTNDITHIWRFANLDYALINVEHKDGFYMEFGVSSGATINYIAARIKKRIVGFDWFQGIPEDWVFPDPNNTSKTIVRPAGSWAHPVPAVRQNVFLVKGLFEKTLPGWTRLFASPDSGKKIGFIHIDADLYSSCKTIFNNIGHCIVEGTVIVFDEWHASGHEDRAFIEFLQESNNTATLISRTPGGQRTFVINRKTQ